MQNCYPWHGAPLKIVSLRCAQVSFINFDLGCRQLIMSTTNEKPAVCAQLLTTLACCVIQLSDIKPLHSAPFIVVSEGNISYPVYTALGSKTEAVGQGLR